MIGVPEWMMTDRYDIEAKADRPLELSDLQQAIMGLLTERFQLKSHRETRDMPAVVLAARGTPRGLKQAGSDERHLVRMDRGDVVFTAASMSALTNYLSNLLTSLVVDETGLNGTYDFELAISQVQS